MRKENFWNHLLLLTSFFLSLVSCKPSSPTPVYQFVESTDESINNRNSELINISTVTPHEFQSVRFNGFFTYKLIEGWFIYETVKSIDGKITDVILDSTCTNRNCSSLTIPNARIEIAEGNDNCNSETIELNKTIKDYINAGFIVKNQTEIYSSDYIDGERIHWTAVDFYFPTSKSNSTSTFYVFKHNRKCFLITSSFVSIKNPNLDDFKYLLKSVYAIMNSISFSF